MKDTTWRHFKDSVQNSRDMVVNLEDGMRFRLVWSKTVYHNPIDGKEYVANWESYEPSGEITRTPSKSFHVQMSQIVFLVQPPPEEDVADIVVAFINSVVEIMEK